MKALLFLLTGVMNPLTVPQTHVLPVFGCGTGCREVARCDALVDQVGLNSFPLDWPGLASPMKWGYADANILRKILGS